jgi:hypothetical protein
MVEKRTKWLVLLPKEKKWKKILFRIKTNKKGYSSMTDHTASTQEVRETSAADQILTFSQELLRPQPTETESEPAIRKRGRPRELSSDHLWLALLVAILRGFTGVASVWRLLTWTGIGSFPLLDFTRDGVRKRLLKGDLGSLQDLLTRVSAALLPWTTRFQDDQLAPFATDVLALDQSTLDAVRRGCEDVRDEAKENPRLLVGKLTGFFDIRRQQWVRLLFREDVFANEKFFVEELFQGILP